MKQFAEIIHPKEYKQWRHNGVAFEIRTASYVYPNRTMSAFVDGHRKRTRDSCIVLGYWGDVIIGPFITTGIDTDSHPEKEKLFRKRNHHYLHISQHVAEFNCYNMCYKLEKLEEYHLNWEEEDEIKKNEAKKNYEKKQQLEEIKEEGEDTEEGKQVKEIEKNRPQDNGRQELISLKKSEEEEEESTLCEELAAGLGKIDIKFFPVSFPVEKMSGKKKFQGLFDMVVNGFNTALDLRNDKIMKILAKGATVYQENCHFLVPMPVKDRKTANQNMLKNTLATLKPVDSGKPSQFKYIAQN